VAAAGLPSATRSPCVPADQPAFAAGARCVERCSDSSARRLHKPSADAPILYRMRPRVHQIDAQLHALSDELDRIERA
jgi:hypothetical protein